MRRWESTGKLQMAPERMSFWCCIRSYIGTSLPLVGRVVGKILVGTETLDGYNYDIAMLSMEGDHVRTPLLAGRVFGNTAADFPRWPIGWHMRLMSQTIMRFTCARSRRLNTGRWQISTSGGDSPLWSPQGLELLYLNGEAVMAVSVKTQP